MAITNGYAEQAEVKKFISEDTDDFNDQIDAAINAVSRAIDSITGRTFYATAATVTKKLTAHFTDKMYIPECVSITSVKTDTDGDRTYATTLTAADHYETNDGSPIHTLYIKPNSTKFFLTGRGNVQIEAEWGYSSTTPAGIKEACILGAARLFRRKDAVFGVVGGGSVGSSEISTHLRQDVDFMMLIEHMCRAEIP